MRRAHAGNYYEPLPTQYEAGNNIEEENEKMTDQLKDKIHILKSLTLDIGEEVKYQDKLLRDMDEDFEKTGGFLGNTINRVLRLGRGGHNYYIFYLFLFALLVFIIVWIYSKFR